MFKRNLLFRSCGFFACLLFLLQQEGYAQLAGGSYTINSAQATGGTNFQTFTDAATALNTGITGPVIINVTAGSGPYNEQMILKNTVGSTAINTVTINGNGNALIYMNTNTNYSTAFDYGLTLGLNGTSHVTVRDLNITSTYTNPAVATAFRTSIAVRLANGASNNHFINCTAKTEMAPNWSSNNFDGQIAFSVGTTLALPSTGFSNNNIIEGCTIIGGRRGMVIGYTSSTDTGNQVLNCVVKDFFMMGISLYAQNNAVLSGNTVERPTLLTPNTFYGLFLHGLNNSLVEKNIIRYPFGVGFYSPYNIAPYSNAYGMYITCEAISSAAPPQENRIINNLIYGFQENGTHYGIYAQGANPSSQYNNAVHHNTIILDEASSNTTNNTYGIYRATSGTGFDFKNNNIYITRGGTGTNYGLYFDGIAQVSNYNNLYVNSSTGTNVTGFYNGSNYTTLSAWQAVNSGLWDVNSVSVDPLFSSPATGYYIPTASAMDNGGTYVNVNDDIIGNTRSITTPDIGAYEYSAQPCAGIPAPIGTASISDASVCFGVNTVLNLAGYAVNPGLTLQWEHTTNPSGTWTPQGAQGASTLTVAPPVPGINYYRCAVTCGAVTVYSDTVQVAVSTPFPAGTYTINSAQATGGTNFQNFSDAVAAISCGIAGPIVFNVAANSGPYNEQVTLLATIGTNAINTVTFNGNGNLLTYNTSLTQALPHTLGLDGADYITVRDLNITANGGTIAYAAHLWNRADNDSFVNCTFSTPLGNNAANRSVFAAGGTAAGVSVTALTGIGNNNILYSCTTNGGYTGIFFNGSSSIDSGNKIINCSVKNFNQNGIHFLNQNSHLTSGNIIERPDSSVNYSFTGINVAGVVNNSLIEKNVIRPLNNVGSNGSGITFGGQATPGNENRISNNLIYGFNGTSSGTVTGIAANSSYLNIHHNTIALDDATATSNGNVIGLQVSSTANVDIRNNNIHITQGGTGIKYGLYYTGGMQTSEYNNVYVNATTGANHIGYYNGAQTTLTAWQTANFSSPWDLNSFSLDPLFTNPSSGNFAPMQPALDNMCIPLSSVTDDILNTLRSTIAADIGAYEFTVPGCSGAPVAGNAAVTAEMCFAQTVSLNLTGNIIAAGLSYQWESATSLSGPWTPAGAALTVSAATDVPLVSGMVYYRCVVSCGSTSTASQPDSVRVVPPLAAGTYTINSAQATAGTNFQSFNDATSVLNCGIAGPVVFDVVPGSGPYNERLVLNAVAGTSTVNTITFRGNGATLSHSSVSSVDQATVLLDGAEYVILDSLNIEAGMNTTSGSAFGVHAVNDADNDTIRNCTITINPAFTSTGAIGVLIAGTGGAFGAGNSDSIVILNNTISGGNMGVRLYGGVTSVLTNNRIIGNTIKDFYTIGVSLGYSTTGTVVAGNDIKRDTRTGGVQIFAGVQLDGANTAAKIDGNRIHNTHDAVATQTGSQAAAYGIYLNNCDAPAGFENIISNNLIYNFNSTGGIQYGLNNVSSDSAKYYHNTIVLDHAASTAGVAYGFYQNTAAYGIEFINNMVSISRGGTGVKAGVYLNTVATYSNGVLLDHNNYYITSPGGNNYFGYLNAINYGTLSTWQTAVAQESNSISFDPFYNAPATGDYTPTANINDLGMPVSILTDILGASRSAVTPDIGAYEFVPPACTTPIAGTAVISRLTVCAGDNVSFNLSGNNSGGGQTYTWESSASINGPYVPAGAPDLYPILNTQVYTTAYYRAAVACGSNVSYSDTVLISAYSGLAGTYTINNNAPTGGNNFNSFREAATALSCGVNAPVVLDVAPGSGPYNERFVLGSIPGTSSVNTVTFNGHGATLGYTAAALADAATVVLDGADYVTLDSLNIAANGTGFAWGIHFTNDADNDTIKNCTVSVPNTSFPSAANTAGIVASGTSVTTAGNSDNIVLLNNTITGAYQGIILTGGASGMLVDNQVIGNTIRDFYAAGIILSYNDNALVAGNDIKRDTRNDVTTFTGIRLGTSNKRTTVTGNRIHDTHNAASSQTGDAWGIYAENCDAPAGQENIVSNNLIYNFNSISGVQYAMYNNSSDSVRYYHNTIVLDYAASTGGVAYGFYQNTAAVGIEFLNNMVTISRAGTGNKHGIYLNTPATFTNGGIVLNNNNYYIAGTAGTNAIGYVNATDYPTLAGWNAAVFPNDNNSMDVNPVYNAPLAGDYTPTVVSLDDKGIWVGVTTDFFNITRNPVTPDIGAVEFAVSPCTGAPTAGNVAVSSGVICTGNSSDLSLSGYTVASGLGFQWESTTNLSGTWIQEGAVISAPPITAAVSPAALGITYYRCAVTCGTTTVYSDTVQVYVSTPLSGIFTINGAQPTGSTNFRSFGDAAAALRCGISGATVFNVTPDTYNEQLVLDTIPGASATNTVTFSGNGATLSYTASFTSKYYATVILNGADHVTLDNLNIEANDANYGFGVHFTNDADNDTIKNCTVKVISDIIWVGPTGYNTGGIRVGSPNATANTGGNSDSLVILNNTIIGASIGIVLTGSASDILSNNQIIGNTIRDFESTGIQLGYNSNALVKGNDIRRDTRAVMSTFTGIQLNAGNTQARIDGNRIHNTHDNATTQSDAYGIFLNSCDARAGLENIVSNNLIYNINNTSGIQYGLRNTGSDSVRYYHNTVVLDDTNSTNGVASGFYQTTLARGVDIRNNIFHITRRGTDTKYGLNFNTATSTITADYNVLYVNASVGTNVIGRSNATDNSTLTAWQSAGYDTNSKDVDPVFANIAADDYTPTDPLVNNMCLPVGGIVTDINGNSRSTVSPDPGAIENSNFPLTIKLASITATNAGANNRIDWNSVSEENTASFDLERSTDGRTFSFLSAIPAKGEANYYTYMDAQPFTGINYYRLKMHDKSGEFAYSKTVKAFVNKDNAFMITAFPNPVKDGALTVRTLGSQGTNAQVQLLDITGKVLSQQAFMGAEMNINMKGVASGVYFIRYFDAVHTETIKITKE